MPSTTKVVTIEDFIKYPNYLFKFSGWIPTQEETKIWQKALGYFMSYNLLASLVLLTMNIIKNLHDSEKLLDITNSTATIGHLAVVAVKGYCVVFCYHKELKEILGQLDEILPKNSLTQKKQNVLETLQKMNSMMIGYIFTYFVSLMLFNLMPFLILIYGRAVQGIVYDLQLPYKVWYPFSVEEISTFFGCYIFQLWGSFYCFFFVVGIDMLFCSCITILCIQFEKLRDETENIVFYSDLKKCVKTHQNLIDISKKLNKIFSASVWFNIIAASVINCLTGFQVTVRKYS